MNHFRKSERWLLAIGTLFLVGSLAISLMGIEPVLSLLGLQSNTRFGKVAEIETMHEMVRRKEFDTPEFQSVQTAQSVFNKDTIMTGKQSGVTIHFLDGSVVEVGPDSLVQIETRGNPDEPGKLKLILNVQKGAVPEVVSSKSVELVREGVKTEIAATLPEATPISSPQAVPEVTPSATPKPSEPAAELLLEGPRLRIPSNRSSLEWKAQAILFTWSSADSGDEFLFELASDDQLKSILQKVETHRNLAYVNVPKLGTYYWRVTDLGSQRRSKIFRVELK